MNILLSSGATREAIDQVRFITNFSTGSTGAILADHFSEQGNAVTCLLGEGAIAPARPCELIRFSSFHSLDREFQRLLGSRPYDCVIHAAAVSDFSVDEIQVDGQVFRPGELPKIDSSASLSLRLSRNHKIVNRLKDFARPHSPSVSVVAFKLTNTPHLHERKEKIVRLAHDSRADLVVHNDFSEIHDRPLRPFTVYRGTGRGVEQGAERGALVVGECRGVPALATLLAALLATPSRRHP